MCRCIYGLLHDRLVILVTHQVQFALQADRILALKEVCLLRNDYSCMCVDPIAFLQILL